MPHLTHSPNSKVGFNMPKQTLSIVVLILFTMSGACSRRKGEMWLEPGSTAQKMVFGVAEKRGASRPVRYLDYFAVRTCYDTTKAQQTLWEVRRSGSDPVPTRISYGTVPPGFSTDVPPRPLEPACYEALMSGQGVGHEVEFIVNQDGSIVER